MTFLWSVSTSAHHWFLCGWNTRQITGWLGEMEPHIERWNTAEGKKWNRKVSLPEPPQTFEMSTQKSQKEQNTSKGKQESDHPKKMESFDNWYIYKEKGGSFCWCFFKILPLNKGYGSEEPSELPRNAPPPWVFYQMVAPMPCCGSRAEISRTDRRWGKDCSDAAWEGFLQGSWNNGTPLKGGMKLDAHLYGWILRDFPENDSYLYQV